MKHSLCAVLIGLVGLGFAACGALAADYGTTGSDSPRSTGSQVQLADKPAGSTVVRGVHRRRGTTAPVAPAPNASPTMDGRPVAGTGRDSRLDGEMRRSHSEPTVVVFFNQSSSVADEVAFADYVNEQVDGYYQPGYDWGAAVKGNTVDWAEFVPYLQQYIVVASPVGKDAFRRGFIAGYGGNAEATYGRALRKACQRSGG